MNNTELIQELSKRLNLKKDEVAGLLSSTVSVISKQLEENNSVTIADIGTLEVKKRKERESVHPVTQRRFLVPPKCVVGFKPSSSLKTKLQESSDE